MEVNLEFRSPVSPYRLRCDLRSAAGDELHRDPRLEHIDALPGCR